MLVWTSVSTYRDRVCREREKRIGGGVGAQCGGRGRGSVGGASRNRMGWHLGVMPWAVCFGVFGTGIIEGRLCAQIVTGDLWRVDTIPSAVFALTEERDEASLSSIVDVVVGPGGVVAVADETLERVVVFSSDGVVVTSFGRVGEGPGEFAAIGSVTAAQQRLFLFDSERMMGTSDDPELVVVDSRGLEVGRVTLEVQVSSTREVHRGDWIAATKADLADLHGEIGAEASRTLEAVGSRLPMAPRIPFAYDVVVDALGYIWVQEYRLPEGPGNTDWKVFAGSGMAIAEVALPEGLDVVAISRDSILAIWTNSVGEQEVRSFRLERPEVVERAGLSFPQCGQLGSPWGS